MDFHDFFDYLWNGRAEKSQSAEAREGFATAEFDKIRRRVEHTKVRNNEFVIRNSSITTNESTALESESESSSLFQRLSEITLVHIFQYARPPNFQTEQEKFKKEDSKNEGVQQKARKYDPDYKYRKQWEERNSKGKFDEMTTTATADEKEMAIAAGAGAVATTTTTTAAATAATTTVVAKKGGRTSGRKRSGGQISYDESSGDLDFDKQLDEYEEEQTLRKYQALTAAASKTTGMDDDEDVVVNSNNNNNDKKLRCPHDIINYLYNPGKKIDLILLNPDTHMTGPCWRDFNRHVKTFPGWTAKRIVATPEEEKKFNFHKKGKGYFVKILYTILDPVKEEKKKKAAAKTAATKKKKKQQQVATTTTVAGAKKPKKGIRRFPEYDDYDEFDY